MNDSSSTPATVGAVSELDSDNDGYPDDIERMYGSSPDDPNSVPGNEDAGEEGVCQGGQAKKCNDKNPCTNDSCDGADR